MPPALHRGKSLIFMDRKTITILALSLVLLLLWYPLTNYLFPPIPLPPETEQPPITTAPDRPGQPQPLAPSLSPAPAAPLVSSYLPEQTLTLDTPDAFYTFTSHGGGLKTIALKRYPATVERRRHDPQRPARLATLNAPASAPVLAILGGETVQGDGVFTLRQYGSGVRAEKALPSGLYMIKEFLPSTNYQLKANVRIENRSGESVALPTQEWIVGTATPIGRRNEGPMLGFEWFDGKSAEHIGESWFANRTLGCIPGTPRSLYLRGSSNVVWAAVHNQFFTLIATPSKPAPAIVGRTVPLPPPTREEIAADPRAFLQPIGYETALVYPQSVLAPGDIIEERFNIYAGPKEYRILARLPDRQDLVMGFGGFFGFFAKALLLSMNGLHALALPYGLAIIVITVIIKLLFWPLTNASTRSMKRMAELQPQMKALQEKYKDDPRKMNMKLMEFMKENKVSPLGGCLPMLLQIPVFFGFYKMLQSAIELRGATFLWAWDLSQPDTIAFIPGLNFPINLLPIIMGATMLWQARLTPVSPGMDPVQQKIMKYMPLMFVFFLYNFSAGLTLYWTVQNLLTIAQMKITRTSTPATPAAAPPGQPMPRKSAPLARKKK
jgi:YidC/Oxa1 family membrane protein insertase